MPARNTKTCEDLTILEIVREVLGEVLVEELGEVLEVLVEELVEELGEVLEVLVEELGEVLDSGS